MTVLPSLPSAVIVLRRTYRRRVLVPTRCSVCHRVGPSPCPACWSTLRPAPWGRPPAGVDRCVSLLAYEGSGRELVARLKYRNSRSAIPWLAAGMAALVAADGVAVHHPHATGRPASPTAPTTDVVTWVPTTDARRRHRGFDQAALLAAEVATRLHLPCRALLTRLTGLPQTGLAARDRRRGPAYEARHPVPRRVLVVDDVLTSGATLGAAAKALRRAGAAEVVAVTAARTPLRVHATQRRTPLKVAMPTSDGFEQP